MAFRIRQKLSCVAPKKIFLQQLQENLHTHVSERVSVDQCVELPKPETMDLGLMIKAGVPLNEVDTKLLNPVGTIKLGSSESEEPKEIESKKE